jgi:hypothetical protein
MVSIVLVSSASIERILGTLGKEASKLPGRGNQGVVAPASDLTLSTKLIIL